MVSAKRKALLSKLSAFQDPVSVSGSVKKNNYILLVYLAMVYDNETGVASLAVGFGAGERSFSALVDEGDGKSAADETSGCERESKCCMVSAVPTMTSYEVPGHNA